MSNTITAFFKGRVGVAEAVYQNDYGIVMNFDSIELPAHFDCYFSTTEGDEAIPGIGADRQVVIPNDCLSRPGNVVLHIPVHTGANDSEVEYVVYFKVIGRARPMDDGTPVQMTAIEQALALLQNPIGNIEQIVNEALAFTGDTFAEMQAKLDEDQAEFQAEIREDITNVESDFDNLNAQFQTAVSALTVDSEVQNIRVGADNVTYTSAGEAIRTQFSDISAKSKNLFNKNNIIAKSNMAFANNIYSNTNVDSKDFFSLRIELLNDSNSVLWQSAYKTINTSGRYNIPFTSPTGATRLRIKHNGSTRDLQIASPVSFENSTNYVFSLEVYGANPSVVGGLSFGNVQVEKGSTMTSYVQFYSANDVNLREEFETTKDAVDRLMDGKTVSPSVLEWELGTLRPNYGTEESSTSRIRSKYLWVGKNTTLKTTSSHLIYVYDMDKIYQNDITWTTDDIVVEDECYIRVLMRNPDDSTIDDVETLANKETIIRIIPQMVVEDVEQLLSDGIPLYFDEQLSTAIETAKDNITTSGINGDSFVFITDLHWRSNQKHSSSLVKKIIDNLNIGKIICGGDLITGGTRASMVDDMNDCVNSYKSITNFYTLFGNHDSNRLDGATALDYFTKDEAYALMQKQMDFYVDYSTPCYYSFDNPTTKTRYICLDTGVEGTTLDSTQKAWLTATLNSMPTGYHALVFAHIIYLTSSWHIGLTPNELSITGFMDEVCEMLDQFNNNNADKKVEAIFGGHGHIDANYTTLGGIPIVLTDCDTRQTFTETSSGSGVANHAIGTVNEQCFDVTTIDYTNRTIKCVRVGRGNNRTISY